MSLNVDKKSLRVLKMQLGRLRSQIETLSKSASTNVMNVGKMECLLLEYRSLKSEFDALTNQILCQLDETDSDYEKNCSGYLHDAAIISDFAATVDTEIQNFRKQLSMENLRDSLVPSSLDQSFRIPSSSNQPKMERIQVPTFDGELLNFNSFKGLFENLIHTNLELSNVQKLHYLKQSMVGKAKDLLRDFELTDATYSEAWTFLLNRFHNRRLITRSLFRKLFEIEPIKHESKIQDLLDEVEIILRGLKAAGESINDTFSRLVVYFVSTRLDFRTSKDWENSVTSCESFPKFEELKKFLQIRAFSVVDLSSEVKSAKTDKTPTSTRKSSFATSQSPSEKCFVCNGDHSIQSCKDFLQMYQHQRFDFVKSNRLCVNCLQSGHSVSHCSSSKCRTCEGPHHTLLHREKKSVSSGAPMQQSHETYSSVSSTQPSSPSSAVAQTSTAIVPTNVRSSFCVSSQQCDKVVVLPTAVVKANITSKTGVIRSVLARVLLDHGSQPTLVSESFIRKNKIVSRPTTRSIIGGITGSTCNSQHLAQIQLESRIQPFDITIEADVIRNIPFSILTEPIRETIRRNSSLQFAEVNLHRNDVDIVIGAEYYELLVLNESLKSDGIFLRNSYFGWIISGPYIARSPSPNQFCNLTTVDVVSQLRKFWEIEEVNCLPVAESEHDRCEKHFLSTYQRNEEGRFVVRLPFKNEKNVIGETRTRAVACLKRVELKYDSDTFSKYVNFMREYQDLGHMSPTQRSNSSSPTYYIPHRAVLRPSSTTTKLRVVFNASSKSKSNFSLNDILMTGPSVQPQLYDILIRFRLHNVAFSADIEKMYRQIFVNDLDRDMQRIVWRETPDDPIQDYKLNTVTYGTASASYIATKCLSVLGDEIANSKPIVARTIQNDFCMDDLLTGAASVEEASALQIDINSQLRSAGFELRKYMSNSASFLDTIDPALVEKSKTIEFRDLQTVSLLGMEWHPVEDSFSIKLNLQPPDFFKSLSRRQILSEISRIFDPLGFLSPVVIKAKMILQEVCKAGLEWDEKVSPTLEKDFLHYYSDLTNLKSFVVRRRVSRFDSAESKLIGFCDASDKAYCAVVYLRSVDPLGNVECYMVTSKTRIAPKNEFKLTIPKLELQAALLLAELLCRVARELSIENNSLLAFSDSTVVLHWLNGSIERWSVFVQNRVRKIERLIPKSRWNYVNTKSNPADLGTRGLNASNFLQHSSFWLYGPSFVLESIENRTSFPFLESSEIPETRLKISLLATNDRDKIRYLDLSIIIERYSSFTKIVKIVYFVICFVSLCKRENFRTICNTSTIANSKNCSLEVQNRNIALNLLIQSEQMAHYRKEIILLKENKRLPKTSSLCSLFPFIDENGILRASSRLNNSNLSYENRNRIILYAKRKFIEKLVSHVHIAYFHSTRNFICNFLSAKYVILGGLTNIVKKVIRNCVTCTRYRGISACQLMGQLPASRVTVSRPFDNVGVDFAGPFNCKCVSHRSIKHFKIYAAFFVCFVTRAIHIEIVSSLSTESFIASLQRFVSRRGIPSNIHSDNATNFIGASNILDLNSPSVQRFAAERTISWHFIAPRAPNHGGIWEAAVKSAKYHLVRVTNGQTLNFEEYGTIFTQIEAILNSRPLCYRRNSQSSPELLTPGHFLIGSSLLSLSIPDSDRNSTLRLSKRFELLRGQIQSFWTTWSKDYLNQIRNRPKWNTLETNLKPGDVVIVKEDNLRPADWSLGIIDETYPDSEGVVRIALVKFKNSLKKRGVNSLIPILSDEDSSPHSPRSMLG